MKWIGQQDAGALFLRWLRRALFFLSGLLVPGSVCLASDSWGEPAASPPAIVGAPVDEPALRTVRGRGAAAPAPEGVAVILWDERNICCVRPASGGTGQLAEPGPNTVSFRLVQPRE
jgi:hypothetical protein